MARKKLIAGNWKMNLTASEGAKLIADLKAACDGGCKCECAPEVLVCPPFTTIAAALEATEAEFTESIEGRIEQGSYDPATAPQIIPHGFPFASMRRIR